MAELGLIFARTRNGVIGRQGQMPWHLPEDLAHFRQLTMGCPVLMGRKTWDSLPRKPLPGRVNVVVTRQLDWKAEGALTAGSLGQATSGTSGTVMVIGGAEIYALALPFADGLVLTEIDQDFAGGTFFPEWDRAAFRETQREAQAADGLRFDFVTYERVAR